MEAGCQQRGIEKRLGVLIPGKHIKDFFDAVIDSLVPSTPRSQQAPIFSDRWRGYDSLPRLDPLGARVGEHLSQRELFTWPSSGTLPAHQAEEWCTLISPQWLTHQP